MFTNRIGDHHAWDSLYEDSATCHGISTTHLEHHHQTLKVGLCNSTSRYCASFIQFHLTCDTAWHITQPVCQCGCDGKHDSTQATTFAQDHSERYDLADAAPYVRRHTSEPRPSHEPVDLPLWLLRPSGELVPSSSMLWRVWHLVSQVLHKHAVERVRGNRRCVVELHCGSASRKISQASPTILMTSQRTTYSSPWYPYLAMTLSSTHQHRCTREVTAVLSTQDNSQWWVPLHLPEPCS